MAKSRTCPNCGGKIKESHTECNGCYNTRRLFKKGLTTSRHKREKAVKHMAKNPNILITLFGVR